VQLLIEILYHITIALKAPVIVLLLLAFAWALYAVGGCLREWRERRKTAKEWQGYLARGRARTESADSLAAAFFKLDAYPTMVATFARRAKDIRYDRAQLEKLISDIEIEANKSCHRMRLGVRVAPLLGLMGTLIPMGPALMGMSKGSIHVMATNMVVAFSTTVVGLLVGAICYVLFTARSHWYAKDILDIEHLFESVLMHQGEMK
jgi:biopolymer transport protein ExbB/TolQ